MSKINFRCFHCDAKLKMPAKYAGRKGRCPKCKAKNTIPSNEDTLEDTIIMMFNDIDKYEDEQNDDEPDPFVSTQDELDDINESEQQNNEDEDDSYRNQNFGNLPNE